MRKMFRTVKVEVCIIRHRIPLWVVLRPVAVEVAEIRLAVVALPAWLALSGEKNAPLFGVFSLCLSRACLGKKMSFSIEWHRKNGRVSLTGFGQPQPRGE